MTGTIFDIKEMAVHDGPGIRTTVFFKGCPMRCVWCHNPEGLKSEPQLMYKAARCIDCKSCQKECSHEECKPFSRCIHACPENCLEITGKTVDSSALADELKSTAKVLGNHFGGFTFSGGEPLSQPQFLLSLIEELSDYHLCIETGGFTDLKTFKTVIEKLDFVIMDLKLANCALHKKYTGVENGQIIENFRLLKASGKPHIIRTPLVPNITDAEENLYALKALVGDSDWEQLPFNAAAGAKYKMLGMDGSFFDGL